MKPTPSGLLRAAVLALALLAGTSAAAYADHRPHAGDELVSHPSVVGKLQTFPTRVPGVGEPPRIAYAAAPHVDFAAGDWVLHRTDGTELALPHQTWTAWAPVGDGAIGMAGTEAGPEVQHVPATGPPGARLVPHFGLAVSPDGRVVAWLGAHGRPHVESANGAAGLALPRVAGGATVAAVTGADTCQQQEPHGGGCTVYVNGLRRVWTSSSDGGRTRVDGLQQVSDVSAQGRVAGLLAQHCAGPKGRDRCRAACWGVVARDGRRTFTSCGYYLDSFSPHGRAELAERSSVRWSSVTRFAVLDARGRVVHTWSFVPGRGRSLTQLTWEDDDHLLAVLQAGGRAGIVRIGLDGTVEYAVAPVTSTGAPEPFSLPLR